MPKTAFIALRISGGSSLNFFFWEGEGGHGPMARAVREPITGVWVRSPQLGSGQSLWSGGQGAKPPPPEAETFLAFGHSLEAANLSTFLKFRNAKKSQIFVLSLQK